MTILPRNPLDSYGPIYDWDNSFNIEKMKKEIIKGLQAGPNMQSNNPMMSSSNTGQVVLPMNFLDDLGDIAKEAGKTLAKEAVKGLMGLQAGPNMQNADPMRPLGKPYY
ncbi:hypothetical protein COL70_09270 [Bacillus pseudomycoides]|uniref:hypothetical protein n=1 Tax=Bacillus pseudomycoides TaxID=64104 RepID=UPI000BF86BAC|nr:hypothetical protein [Bacillus pseudomycoides]PFZ93247.1 hypothetical protein COL70_09270 [Bacillus pseudomycoides]